MYQCINQTIYLSIYLICNHLFIYSSIDSIPFSVICSPIHLSIHRSNYLYIIHIYLSSYIIIIICITSTVTFYYSSLLNSAYIVIIPFNVFCSFFEGGLMNSPPLKTFTAQVPQIPAPPQLPDDDDNKQWG